MSVEIKVTSDSRQADADLRRLEQSLGKLGTKAKETSDKLGNIKIKVGNEAEKEIAKIDKSLKGLLGFNKIKISADTSSARRNVVDLRKEIDSTANSANLLSSALRNIALASVGIGALKAAADFETLQVRLETLTGSVAEAQGVMQELNVLVKATPFGLSNLTDAYSKLAATGNKAFASQSEIVVGIRAISDAVAAVGGGNQKFDQVVGAIEKMSTEGRITAERLNQLADASIPLTRVASRLGMTMNELRAESEAGTFAFAKFYKAFLQVAQTDFGGASAKQADTLSGSISNLNDTLSVFFDTTLRGSGITSFLTRILQNIDSAISSLTAGLDYKLAAIVFTLDLFRIRVLSVMNGIGRVFTTLFNKINDLIPSTANSAFGKKLSQFANTILDSFKSLGDINLRDILDKINDKINNWQPKKIELGKFIPNLDQVMKTISAFGKFVKGVFYDIWDAVVGHSYWPDTIDGISEWADKLRTKVSSKILSFGTTVKEVFSKVFDYVSNIFRSLKENEIVGKWVKLFEKLGVTIKDNLIYGYKTAKDFISSAAGDVDVRFKISESISNEIKRLRLDEFSDVIYNAFSRGIEKIQKTDKMGLLVNALDLAILALFARYNTGFRKLALLAGGIKIAVELQDLLVSTAFKASVEQVGKFIGRTLKDLFTSETESGVIGLLDKIRQSIQLFGKSILEGAGLSGFAQLGGAGLITGLIFTVLTTAVLSNKLGNLISFIWKTLTTGLGEALKAKQIGNAVGTAIGTSTTSAFATVISQLGAALSATAGALLGGASAGGAWATLGATIGGLIQKGIAVGFKIAGGIGGAFAGTYIADKIISSTGITGEFNKLAVTLASTFVFSFVAGIVAEQIGLRIAAAIFAPAAIGAAITAAFLSIKATIIAVAISTATLLGEGILGRLAFWLLKATASVVAFVAGIPAAIAGAVLLLGGGVLYLILGDENGLAGRLRKVLSGWFDQFKGWAAEVGKMIAEAIVPDFLKPGGRFGKQNSNQSRNTVDWANIPQFQTGGYASGPGTGKSDSILSRLSNGEFVVNSSATAKYRNVLEAINSNESVSKVKEKLGQVSSKVSTRVSELRGDLLSIFSPKKIIEPAIEFEPIKDINPLSLKTLPGGESVVANVKSLLQENIGQALSQQGLLTSQLNSLNSNWQNELNLANSDGKSLSGTRSLIIDKRNRSDFFSNGLFEYDPALPKAVIPDIAQSDDGRFFDRAYSVMLHEFGHGFDFGNGILANLDPLRTLANRNGLTPGSEAYRSFITDGLINSYLKPYWNDGGFTAKETNASLWATKNSLFDNDSVSKSLLFGNRDYLRQDIENGKLSVDRLFESLTKDHLDFLDNGKIDNSVSNALFNSISESKDISKLRSIAKFASGGSVFGAGSATSDSIPALLSNGEFVVNAKAAGKYRSLLESINSNQIPKFQKGGWGNESRMRINEDPFPEFKGKTSKEIFDAAVKLENASGDLEKLANAILKQESGGNLNAPVSVNGARGPMQILPATFKSVADASMDIRNPLDNMRAGIRYLQKALIETHGDLRLSAAYYYSGPGGAAKAAANIPVRNTLRPSDPTQLQYADQVLARMGIQSNSVEPVTKSVFANKAGSPVSVALDKPIEFKFNEDQGIKLSEAPFVKYLGKFSGETTKEKLSSSGLSFADKIDLSRISDLDTLDRLLDNASGYVAEITKELSQANPNVNFITDAAKSLDALTRVISKQALGGLTPSERKAVAPGPSDDAERAGANAAKAFQEDFKSGFSELLKGKVTFKDFKKNLLLSFTGKIVDNFSNAIVDDFFASGLKSVSKNLFTGSFSLGESTGGFFSGMTKWLGDSVKGLFSGFGDMFKGFDLGSMFSSVTKFFGFADGGMVSGPGSSRSDSIPAMLSNGEFVVNARATSKYGDLLSLLNSGKSLKFADGGFVGGTLSGSINDGSLSSNAVVTPQVINLNITGDISRQTKSEIYRMLPSIAEGVNSHNREKGLR